MNVFLSAVLLILVLAPSASAEHTVFVVRHAERADEGSGGSGGGLMMASDPELSEKGRARAEALAAILRDAGITAIFVTEFKRTQQTAAPLAKALGLQVTSIPSRDRPKLVAALKQASGNVLVVGHSNTVPAIIEELGVKTGVTLKESDYDNLFLVVTGTAPKLIRLHFDGRR